ncbi:MAG: hypothetical protein KDD69_04085 [Bdellovibrionales bacterium]|nr:hypothetical protein [Bdellovibrionales bacterium]
MRKAASAALLGGTSGITLAESYADPLPADGPEQLSLILQQPAFQPRGTNLSWLESMKRDLLIWLAKVQREILDALRDFRSPFPNDAFSFLDPLFHWLKKLYEVLGTVLPVIAYSLAGIAGLGILYLVGRALLRQRGLLAEQVKPHGQLDDTTALRLPSLSDVRMLGLSKEALIAFRTLVRARLLQEQVLPESLTDREIRRAVPNDHRLRQLFDRLSGLFEDSIYAGRPVEAPALELLLTQYGSLEQRKR